MAVVTASIVLSATLMMLWGATMLVLMTYGMPLIQQQVLVSPPRQQQPGIVPETIINAFA